MDLNEALKKNFIDFYPDTENLLVFGFSLEDINNRKISYKDINVIIFKVFKELITSKNKKLREAVFTIYVGDYNGFYWVGLRTNISIKISELFAEKFKSKLGGFYPEMEYDQYPHIPIIAKYKYNKGEIIEYDGEEMLGQTRIDTDEWYESGLKVIYKEILPNSLGNIRLKPE